MKLQKEKAIMDIAKNICEFSLQDLIKLWNDIFPKEEWICKETFEGKTNKEVEMLSDELTMFMIDEISCYSNDILAEIYGKIFEENEMEIIDEIEIEMDIEEEF